ncbi:MAG TPA: beta-galactosidase, partial [Fodinibius sp.]|nr:beta-galactosidase [Fodinibius sp.]
MPDKRHCFSICLLLWFFIPYMLYSQDTSRLYQDEDIPPPGSYETDFFPVSVWYSGGKARAPMLSEITPQSRGQWLQDLQQIKSLGFNTVRTWVEWTAIEPREDEYNFKNLHLLMELAEQVGLKVFIQIYIDSAPDWVGEKYGEEALYKAQSGD